MSRIAAQNPVPGVALLLGALALVNAYRAWAQSITYDEAFTYPAFVAGPIDRIFTSYSANNHVLFSILAKATTGAIGASEFSLRLPSVVAGVVYFAAVFLLARLLFGRGAIFAATVAGLALNPFVLDFLSAARGYGLALAFLMVALYQLAVILVRSGSAPEESAERRRWVVASLALAASVSSNLAFLFPVVGLGLATLTVAALDALGTGSVRFSRFARRAVLPFCLPGLVAASALLVVPLGRATREHFLYGAGRLGDTVRSLVEVSLRHHPSRWPIDTEGSPAATLRSVTAVVLIPLAVTALVATAGVAARGAIRARSMANLTPQDRVLFLLTGMLAVTLAQLAAVHRLWDVPYPLDRTAIYFIPIFILALALLAQRAALWSGWAPTVRAFSLILLGGLICQSITQFNVGHYTMWRFDAGARTLYDIVSRWPGSGGDTPLRVAASRWRYQPSLDYYRLVEASPRVVLVSDGWARTETSEFDFFVVAPPDADSLRGVATFVCAHPISGAMLFVNRSRHAARELESVRRGVSADCERVRQALRSS